MLGILAASTACSGGESEPAFAPEAVGVSEQAASATCPRRGPPAVDIFKELIAVHPTVLDDARASSAAGGPWSFRALVEQMAPLETDPADFVLAWLNEWNVRTSINGFPLDARTGIQNIINTWPKTAAGKFDLARAPFKLLAIVNRMDLRSEAKPNGEGRFVFAVLTPPAPGGQRARSFTVIFEFNLPSDGGKTAASWAEDWHGLASKQFGRNYNAALQAVTDKFTRRGSAAAGVNRSAISQVRTNEIDLASPWELREFHLDGQTKLLRQATTGNNPDRSLNDSASPLTEWIEMNQASILAGTHTIPQQFLGGISHSDGVTWQFPGMAESLRKGVARETCNGCHNGEVDSVIDGFYHISPSTPPGAAGQNHLSTFLKDVDLPRRRTMFQQTLCPAPGTSLSADGTPKPPKANGKTH